MSHVALNPPWDVDSSAFRTRPGSSRVDPGTEGVCDADSPRSDPHRPVRKTNEDALLEDDPMAFAHREVSSRR